MRVLQIGLSKNIGGIESFVMSYFRELVNHGIIFDFVDIYGDGLAFLDEIETLGGKIFTLKNYKKHPLKAKKQLAQIIRDEKYEVIHVNMLSAANILPFKAAKRANCKTIAHSHNTATKGFLRKLMHRLNLKKLNKLANVKLACGKQAGKWLFGKNKFTIIPNAIDIDKFKFDSEHRKEIRDKLNIKDDAFVLGFVGRLSYQKNPLYLVDILSAVKKYTEKDVKLLIIGDGELKRAVIEKAESFNVSSDIIWAGKQKDVALWYSAMDCFVLPSLFEGFGIVALEAQGNGLNCYLSDNIPQEVEITDLVKYLPLEDCAYNWGEMIAADAENCLRQSECKLKDTVFDIKKSAHILKEIYINGL